MTPSPFDAAVAAFARIHAEDPRLLDGVPSSVRYHEHLVRWVTTLDPDAPEAVLLAAHCQHIRRWAVPRADFPAGRDGYRRWRSTLAMAHAADAQTVLREVGYEQAVVTRVRDLLMKKRLRSDRDVALLQDAVCLTFLELELEAFATKHPDDKVVDILRKTWDKMSEAGQQAARSLAGRLAQGRNPPHALALLQQALNP